MRRALALFPVLLAACAAAEPRPEPAPVAKPPAATALAAPPSPPLRPVVVPESGFHPDGPPPPVPADARVTLESDFNEWFVGEKVTLRLVLRNEGSGPIPFETGGDQGGVNRPLRLHVRATNGDGREAEDPGVQGNWYGGLAKPRADLPPECAVPVDFALLAFCRIDRPGIWTIQAGHDFGWQPTPDRPIPVATLRLRFLECPDPAAARRVTEVLDGDYTVLAEAKYLPYLERRVRSTRGFDAGTDKAWEAIRLLLARDPGSVLPVLERFARDNDGDGITTIGESPTKAATRILVELFVADADAFEDAGWELEDRLPPPKGPADWFQPIRDSDDPEKVLLRSSWDPALAPSLLAWARKSVSAEEGSEATLAVRFLQCLGDASDAVPLRQRMERLLSWGDPPNSEVTDCLKAVRGLLGPGFHGEPDPNSLAAIYEYLDRLGESAWDEGAESSPPVGWERVVVRLLGHERNWVRSFAAGICPTPVPPEAVRRLPDLLLRDPSRDVRHAACSLAARTRDPAVGDALVRLLREGDERFVLQAAQWAARQCGRGDEGGKALAARLRAADPMRAEALQVLCWSYLEGLWEIGSGVSIDVSDSAWEPLEERWLRFLDETAGRLDSEGRVPLTDPAIRPGLLGGALVYTLPDGSVFPPPHLR